MYVYFFSVNKNTNKIQLLPLNSAVCRNYFNQNCKYQEKLSEICSSKAGDRLVETQSSTQASPALRARSQTRPCCRASCTAGCTAGFTADKSRISISQARYLRPCNRNTADWWHALSSEKSLTSHIQVQTSWEKPVVRNLNLQIT